MMKGSNISKTWKKKQEETRKFDNCIGNTSKTYKQ